VASLEGVEIARLQVAAESRADVSHVFGVAEKPLMEHAYGTERSYDGLRLAGNMITKHEGTEVDVFLLGDAVACAKASQATPNGYDNLERMLKPILRRGLRPALLHRQVLPHGRRRHPAAPASVDARPRARPRVSLGFSPNIAR
jgi:hypothetical protein